jgi:2-methylcitrate dehydratase PrpD
VIHPVIDACVQARAEGVGADDVARIDTQVHPMVLELTGKTAPRSGLEGKFSVFHAAAVALIDGAGTEREFSDARVNAPDVVALRDKVHARADASLGLDAANVTITLTDGSCREWRIAHCSGSRDQPLTDVQLDAKFRAQAEPVMGETRTVAALKLWRQFDGIEDVRTCTRECAIP